MTELYIFSQNDKLLTVLSESTGLLEAPFREELNQGSSFSFTLESGVKYEHVYNIERNLTQIAGQFIGAMERTTYKKRIEPAKYVKEENQVVFRDKESDLRLYVIKEIHDHDSLDGTETTATCEAAFMELRDHIVVDRRFNNQTPDIALDAAIEGTSWTGKVEVDLFKEKTN